MHRVSGYKDIGVDYFCEWLHEDTPSGVLFGIQAKTTEKQDIKLVNIGINRRLNELDKFQIQGSFPFTLKESSIRYWETLEIPLYLFIVIKNNADIFNCYYSRLTPILHKNNISSKDKIKRVKKSDFYLANNSSTFHAKKLKIRMDGGFARDLLMDHIRCSYKNGSVLYKNPNDFGVNWPTNKLFPTILGEDNTDYTSRLKSTLLLLEKCGLLKVGKNFEQKIEELKKKVSS